MPHKEAAADTPQSPVLTMHTGRQRLDEVSVPAPLQLPKSVDGASKDASAEAHGRGEHDVEEKETGQPECLQNHNETTDCDGSQPGTDGEHASTQAQPQAVLDEGNLNSNKESDSHSSKVMCAPVENPAVNESEFREQARHTDKVPLQPDQTSSQHQISLLTTEPDETEPPSPPPGSASPSGSSTPSEPRDDTFCPRCSELYEENDYLSRKAARLRQKLQDTIGTTQTHGQRLLRAAFQDQVRELTQEHAQKTTEMLNMQKKCFEDELEALDAESQAAVSALTRERDAEREARTRAEERFQKEREAALERTTATMVAVQRKMAQLHARATRLEREKKSLTASVSEKQVMIEVLASAAAAKDVERRRLDLLSTTQKEERERKDSLIQALQNEADQLREKLGQERQVNLNLMTQMQELEGERHGDRERHTEELEDCKQQSKKETERVGRLFASMIQDFTNVQSDVSTND